MNRSSVFSLFLLLSMAGPLASISAHASDPTIILDHDGRSPQEEIEYLEGYISSIRKKMEVVSADPDKKREAKKSGWFKEMKGYIQDSEKRIKELQEELDQQDLKD